MNILTWQYRIRHYMDSYLGFMKGTPLWSLVWVVAICAVIWFFGTQLGIGQWRPLAPQLNRLVAIGVVVTAWLLFVLVRFFRNRRREKALIDDLADDEAADPQAGARAEVSELRGGLKDALIKMRAVTKKRFNFVYDFPWYMIIGAPGSGKTTALLNAGLEFPLGEDVAGGDVGRVSGTRNCDWWFTDEAILIDTAGRYTTQDSDATVDGAGWQGFLDMIKKHRPLKPINGVIVTVSMRDALTRSPQERIKDIRVIRQRLRDLEESLKVRLPVYLIFTKVDMIAGFSEFFDSFNKFDREQVLGTTFPVGVSQGQGTAGEAFSAQFDLILERIGRILLERMQQEPDDIRRSKVFRFPAQFAGLKPALTEMVSELTSASKLVRAPLLRGVYFASATQSGEVFDRTRAAVSERFSFLPDGQVSGVVGNRPFFLSRLFGEVIFNEANLVTTDRKVRRRKAAVATVAYALPLLLLGGLAFGWGHAWFSNQATLASVNARIGAYQRDVEGLPVEQVRDSDLLRLIAPLNELRDAIDVDVPGTDRWFHVGLSQEEKLAVPLASSYQRALNELLLPRILVFLQNAMNSPSAEPAERYRRLKLYLMLGRAGEMDIGFALETMRAELEAVLPGAARRPDRNDLVGHLERLISQPGMRTLELDQAQIDATRTVLRQKLPAQRVHDIVGSARAGALPQWRPEEKAGSGAQIILTRRSGLGLREGVAGIYTRAGFYRVVLPQLHDTARDVLAEHWVFGEGYIGTQTLDDIKLSALREYFTQAQTFWSALLDDITVRDSADLAQAMTIARDLSSPDNAVVALARAAGEDTNFRSPPPPAPARGAEGERTLADAAAQAIGAVEAGAGEALALLPARAAADLVLLENFGDPLVDPYARLRAHMSADGDNAAPVATLQPIFTELFTQLSNAVSLRQAGAGRFGLDSGLSAANQRLVNEAARLPLPLDRWMGKFAGDIARLSSSGARQSLSELWRTTGGNFCRIAVAGRYPFVSDAPNEVAIGDFIRMFGPSGEFATFFNTNMRQFVDITRSPWRWTGPAGNEAIASDALAQFERADKIRQAFFGGGGLSLDMDITPVELDANATAVMLTIHDKAITYDHGPVRTQSFNWPGVGNRSARIAFQPGGNNAGVTLSGPWAMFRLFEMSRRQPLSENRFRATFNLGGRRAMFDVQLGSVLNPFTLPEIERFRCPDAL